MSRSTWLTGFMAAGLAIFAGWPVQARADGEVGLVVENAGVATTYCIAYSGDGIPGEEMLRRAGYTIEQFGGGGGRTVCAIGETGCNDASSFNSCFCQCQGANCVYWAFFTREYGKPWVYSVLAFNLLKADDGDVHGWKWGAGAPNSAPAPAEITFEQICGHAPRGGAAATATPGETATMPASTLIPPSATAVTSAMPGETARPPIAASTAVPPTVVVTLSATAAGQEVTVVQGSTPAAAGETPADGDEGDDGGGIPGSVLAFGALATAMLAAIAAALIWRGRNGG